MTKWQETFSRRTVKQFPVRPQMLQECYSSPAQRQIISKHGQEQALWCCQTVGILERQRREMIFSGKHFEIEVHCCSWELRCNEWHACLFTAASADILKAWEELAVNAAQIKNCINRLLGQVAVCLVSVRCINQQLRKTWFLGYQKQVCSLMRLSYTRCQSFAKTERVQRNLLEAMSFEG